QFLAGVLVESNHGAPLAADQTDELVAVQKRVRGEAPDRHRSVVIAREVLRPEHLPRAGIQAEEIPHRAQGVNLAPGDDRRGPRTGGILDVVPAVIFMLPQLLAGLGVQAEHPLLALDPTLVERIARIASAIGEDAVGDVDLAASDGWPG